MIQNRNIFIIRKKNTNKKTKALTAIDTYLLILPRCNNMELATNETRASNFLLLLVPIKAATTEACVVPAVLVTDISLAQAEICTMNNTTLTTELSPHCQVLPSIKFVQPCVEDVSVFSPYRIE